jgi:hypothetical protein
MLIGTAYLLVLASVPLARGRLTALADLQLRRPGFAIAAILIQIVVISVLPTGDHAIHTTLHLGSYVLLGAFAFANRAVVGVPIVAFGGLLNFIAITANGGVMPTDPDVAASGARMVSEGEFINSRPIDDANLQFLGDAFATPSWLPIQNVFSIGDVILLLGVAVLVHAACGSRLIPHRFAARPAAA